MGQEHGRCPAPHFGIGRDRCLREVWKGGHPGCFQLHHRPLADSKFDIPQLRNQQLDIFDLLSRSTRNCT